MSAAVPGRLARRARGLSPRAAVLTGGALMVAGQVLVAVLLTGAGLPSLDASVLLIVPVLIAGIVMLWLGPVVVAMAAGQPGWIGAIALPGGYAVFVLGTLGTSPLSDGAVLAIVEGALSVFSFAGTLAVVGGGRVWRRLFGVAVIAGVAGALSHLFQNASVVVPIGLLMAIGFLAWIAPRTRLSDTSLSPDATPSPPPDGS